LGWTRTDSTPKTCGAEFQKTVEALLDGEKVVLSKHRGEFGGSLRIGVICDPGLDLVSKIGVDSRSHA
jgi:hypothetical protein